jgi:hypothetical protein
MLCLSRPNPLEAESDNNSWQRLRWYLRNKTAIRGIRVRIVMIAATIAMMAPGPQEESRVPVDALTAGGADRVVGCGVDNMTCRAVRDTIGAVWDYKRPALYSSR